MAELRKGVDEKVDAGLDNIALQGEDLKKAWDLLEYLQREIAKDKARISALEQQLAGGTVAPRSHAAQAGDAPGESEQEGEVPAGTKKKKSRKNAKAVSGVVRTRYNQHSQTPFYVTQEGVRICVHEFMGVPHTDPLPDPLADGEFWFVPSSAATVDADAPSGASGAAGAPAANTDPALRPQFEASWEINNTAWGRPIAERIQKDGHKYTESLTRKILDEWPIVDIQKQVGTYFKSMCKRYAAQQKGQTADKSKFIQRKKTVSTALCLNTSRTHIVPQKAQLRTKAMESVPGGGSPKWRFLKHWPYQSTDESAVEARDTVVDPGTDDEHAPPVEAPELRKFWEQCAPCYRHARVSFASAQRIQPLTCVSSRSTSS